MLGEIYRVSFIGHRQIDRFRFVEEQLDRIISDLMSRKEYMEFYIGRNGDFDTMVASAVKRGQKAYGTANSSLILVIHIPLPIWIASNNSTMKYGIPMNSTGYIIKPPSPRETSGL